MRGEVVGPDKDARMCDGDPYKDASMLAVKFEGNKGEISCLPTELSHGRPREKARSCLR